MHPGLKFAIQLVAITIAVPSAIALLALSVAWLVWPLMISLAALKYLFF